MTHVQGRPGTRGGRGHGARGMCLVCERHAGGVLHGGGGEGRPRGAVDCVIELSLVGCRACGPAMRHIVSVEATTRNYINVRIYSISHASSLSRKLPSIGFPRSGPRSSRWDSLSRLALGSRALQPQPRDCHISPRHGPDTHTSKPHTSVSRRSTSGPTATRSGAPTRWQPQPPASAARHLHYCLAHVT